MYGEGFSNQTETHYETFYSISPEHVTRPSPPSCLSVTGKDTRGAKEESHDSWPVWDKSWSLVSLPFSLIWGHRSFCSLCFGWQESSSRGSGDARSWGTLCARRRGALQEMAFTIFRGPRVSVLWLLRFWLLLTARALEIVDITAPELSCSEVRRQTNSMVLLWFLITLRNVKPSCETVTKIFLPCVFSWILLNKMV